MLRKPILIPAWVGSPYTTLLHSTAATSLQEGQTKTSNSGHTPSLGIVRPCFMAFPQQPQTGAKLRWGAVYGDSSAAVRDAPLDAGMFYSFKQSERARAHRNLA
jgi:hypothetical protein